MKMYDGMLPEPSKPGYLGYYPVTSREEWDELPALYKVMEWETVKDPHDKNKPKAVKAVVFDVTYMEPYGIRAKVSVHPEEVQKILFCSFKNADCQLYSISGIELEGGTKIGAKWLQDSVSGAFEIVAGSQTVARQGGFRGFIPERVQRTEDGTFKFDFNYTSGKTTFYTLSNPFPRTEPELSVNHLLKFIEEEVPFRLEELYGLDVSNDVLSSLIEELKDHNDVMFDYDALDNWLLKKYDELTEEKDKLKSQTVSSSLNEKIQAASTKAAEPFGVSNGKMKEFEPHR